MPNLAPGVGISDIPGWRSTDVAADLALEAWEESIDPEKIGDALVGYMEFDLPPMSDHLKAELLNSFVEIAQRMTTGHLAELGNLGAHFGCNAERPAS